MFHSRKKLKTASISYLSMLSVGQSRQPIEVGEFVGTLIYYLYIALKPHGSTMLRQVCEQFAAPSSYMEIYPTQQSIPLAPTLKINL